MGNSGRFITFEGIDGAGKSTHIEALAERFRQRGRTVLVTREPGGTPLAEKVRALVLHDAMDVLSEALLVFAARRDHLLHAIEPALQRGEVVLCDRFTDSSFAYQGGGRGLDLGVLSTLEHWVQGGSALAGGTCRQPDLTLWFDLSPAQAAMRLSAARQPDKFESQSQDFFARVARGFEARAAAQPQRFVRFDAGRDRLAVWSDVEAAVSSRGWLT
jgi:dTMP kinase